MIQPYQLHDQSQHVSGQNRKPCWNLLIRKSISKCSIVCFESSHLRRPAILNCQDRRPETQKIKHAQQKDPLSREASQGNWTAADSRCFEYLWIIASSKVSFGHRPQWHARPHSNRKCENRLRRKIWLIAALHLLLPPFVPPYHLLATYLPPWSRNPKQSEEITSSCVFSRLHFHHVFSTPETPWDPCGILRFQASL